jgi:hypothetical protein
VPRHVRWERPGLGPCRPGQRTATCARRRSAHGQLACRCPSARAGRGEVLPSLEAARLEHVASTGSRHPNPEAVGLAAVRLLGLKGSLYRISPAVRTSQIASGDATERRARTAWSRQYIRSTHPHLPEAARGRAGGASPTRFLSALACPSGPRGRAPCRGHARRLSSAPAIARLTGAPAGRAPPVAPANVHRPLRQRRRSLSTPVHILWTSGFGTREVGLLASALGRHEELT